MEKINIVLNDGAIKTFSDSIKVIDVAKSISPSIAKKTLYGLVDDQHQNNNFIIDKDAKLKLITLDAYDDEIINGECIKMIAKIVKDQLPELKVLNIAYDQDYFYLDFDTNNAFKEKDLALFTNKINKLVKFVELDPKTSLITNKKYISNFKFNNVSGIYLDGDKTKQMITRITGLASVSSQALSLKEAAIQKRLEADHRIIGQKMKIFTFNNLVGQGLPIWLPNGTVLKNEIKKYLKSKQLDYGFLEVETPILATADMYRKSGHLSHYSDDMFPIIKKNGEELMLRPMSCPHHIAVFNNDLYSYNDLPLRLNENATLFRYEKSGALTGLERVRMMELVDAHIFTDFKHLKSEFKNCFKLISEVLATFDIKIDYFSLSLRDKNNKVKFFDDDAMWNNTESILTEVLDELKIDYKAIPGEAAFYGPKLDVQIKSVLNHEITVSTIQLDMLGAKNFNATYIDANNKKVNPIIIHFGLVGTFERFISILLEQTKGFLPLWLAPEQVRIIPINEDVKPYCEEVRSQLVKNGIRAKIDLRNERLNYKVRDAQVSRIPYQLVIGKDEAANKLVSIRKYSETNSQSLKITDFIKNINQQIKSKK